MRLSRHSSSRQARQQRRRFRFPAEITAGTGCSVHCIVKALVTPTASYANVAIETSVPTKISVLAWHAPAQGGAEATFHSSAFHTHRTVFLPGLKPDTPYQIYVKATDAQGRSDARQGSFKTRKVETAVDTGMGNIKSNVGCSIQCVRKALFTHVGGTEARIEVETGEPAKLQVMLSPEAPIQESWGPRFSFIERSVSTQALVTNGPASSAHSGPARSITSSSARQMPRVRAPTRPGPCRWTTARSGSPCSRSR